MTLDVSLIGRLLHAQDNRATREPIYIVQQKRRITGMDTRWAEAEQIVWMDDHQGEECFAEESALLEKAWNEGFGEEPDGRTRTAFIEIWEFVTCCFTEAAAARYVEENRHNLNEPRIYVESGHRNREWQAVRAHLKELAL